MCVCKRHAKYNVSTGNVLAIAGYECKHDCAHVRTSMEWKREQGCKMIGLLGTSLKVDVVNNNVVTYMSKPVIQ